MPSTIKYKAPTHRTTLNASADDTSNADKPSAAAAT
jgi:hypothetical protein